MISAMILHSILRNDCRIPLSRICKMVCSLSSSKTLVRRNSENEEERVDMGGLEQSVYTCVEKTPSQSA